MGGNKEEVMVSDTETVIETTEVPEVKSEKKEGTV